MALAVVPCVYMKCVHRTDPEMREMLRQTDAVSGKIFLSGFSEVLPDEDSVGLFLRHLIKKCF